MTGHDDEELERRRDELKKELRNRHEEMRGVTVESSARIFVTCPKIFNRLLLMLIRARSKKKTRTLSD